MPAPEGFVDLSGHGNNCWAQVVTLNLIPSLIAGTLPPGIGERFRTGYEALLRNFNECYNTNFSWGNLRDLFHFHADPANPFSNPLVQQMIFGPVLRQYYINYVLPRVVEHRPEIAGLMRLDNADAGNDHHVTTLLNSLGFLSHIQTSDGNTLGDDEYNSSIQVFGGNTSATGNFGTLTTYREGGGQKLDITMHGIMTLSPEVGMKQDRHTNRPYIIIRDFHQLFK